MLAEDVLSENGFPPSPLPSVPKPGSERKLSRRRRLTNFLLRRGHHRSTRKHHHGHPRKKHRGWIKRRQPRANSSGSSSSSLASSLGSEEDRIGSLEDERIGRPPMCGASYGDWSVPGADSYSVRQYDYKQTKEKGFSATPSFYELHAIDTYCSPSRMDRIFEHVEVRRIEQSIIILLIMNRLTFPFSLLRDWRKLWAVQPRRGTQTYPEYLSLIASCRIALPLCTVLEMVRMLEDQQQPIFFTLTIHIRCPVCLICRTNDQHCPVL